MTSLSQLTNRYHFQSGNLGTWPHRWFLLSSAITTTEPQAVPQALYQEPGEESGGEGETKWIAYRNKTCIE